MATVLENKVPNSKRDKVRKWNGWGYRDSFFCIDENKNISFTGDHYDISGQMMPHLWPWLEAKFGIDLSFKTPSRDQSQMTVPCPVLNNDLFNWLKEQDMSFSNAAHFRINRAHGHTIHDLITLRSGKFERLPDMVVWPKSHNEVVALVLAAVDLNVVIIPIGGGTSVTSALECPAEETRCIVSLDMSEINKIIWIDSKNQLCCAEAGIVGIELEEKLKEKGFTTGHEPDSIEFSTLGGWVATRASGMKKNKYGNIEDLLVHVKLVTAHGVMQKSCQVPRMSSGPDIHHFILGSEGTLGVITEVTLKICPIPECKKYGSIVFSSFEPGVQFMREVAKQRVAPANLRLVDNEQLYLGKALMVKTPSYWNILIDTVENLYITKWMGFKQDQMCAATLVLEGTSEEVEAQEKRLYNIGKQFGGVPAGEENGRYGYQLIFTAVYLRDFVLEYSFLGESFETSVPWDKVIDLCRNVKELLHRESEKHGIKYPIFASSRVTQIYDSGACVYFYFGFNYRGIEHPLKVCKEIERAARDEILACSGSISHHHGVGKLRKQWMSATIGDAGLLVMKAIKSQLDPNNIFANGNIFTPNKL